MTQVPPLYLGFDCSTQGLTATVLEIDASSRRVVFERSIDFDCDLPSYGTTNGVLRRSDDPAVVCSSPRMWAEALDRMMGVIAGDRAVDRTRIKAISGSAQQHGSVYLNGSAGPALARLDPARPLADQIGGIFSREVSPIWMDCSTSAQCAAITQSLGGADRLARLTGSRAFERFTGPQIRKFFEQDPESYRRTSRIHLVSSYLASLLAGRHAPIDPGDGSGMNLMDLASRRWAEDALRATAPDLEQKLPELKESWTDVGRLAPYWTERYGFPPARIIAWSGDNPCSLIGVGLVREGRVAISMGTSDTVFGFMREPRVDRSGTGHVFGAPTGDYMGLTCFMNGSLARERIRDEHRLDWTGFSAVLRATPPGNGGAILLPWFEPEITPFVPVAGARRVGLDPADASANVRAVVEGQMMAMARHAAWMGVRIDTIHATGGAAANREILRVMADVFDADVCQLEATNSACLGAALRAFHGDRRAEGHDIPWEDVVAGFAEPVAGSRIAPIPTNVAVYKDLKKIYAECEANALAGLTRPPA